MDLKSCAKPSSAPTGSTYAFRTYVNRWAFKHPTPYDFFPNDRKCRRRRFGLVLARLVLRNLEIGSGYSGGSLCRWCNAEKGALITIENLEKLAMPVIVEVQEVNGRKVADMTLPVEIWQRGGNWTFKYPSTARLSAP